MTETFLAIVMFTTVTTNTAAVSTTVLQPTKESYYTEKALCQREASLPQTNRNIKLDSFTTIYIRGECISRMVNKF